MSKSAIPGSVYLNHGRYYWRVKFPGENKYKAVPLKPVGARFATKDRKVAEAVAFILWEQACREPVANDAQTGTIVSLVSSYLAYAKRYYPNSREPENIRPALTVLVAHYANIPAQDFGPLKLKALREHMIEKNWCRSTVNKRVSTVKRMFKWAASEQRVPEGTYHGLQTVEGLRRGRSQAIETEPVTAVAETHVKAILPYTSPVIATMIELQLLTGMRSGELTMIRPVNIETSGDIWYYRPSEHKTSYKGHVRIVPLGPRAQKLIAPFLKRDLQAYCFTPAESEIQRGHGAAKNLSDRYDSNTYRKAVKYAIRAALKAGLNVPAWYPHQLRHSAATKIRKRFGLDAAKAVLGHRSTAITETYAEIDKGLSSQVAREIG